MAEETLALHSAMLSAGIVGLPNVGKSTLFNAVTRTHKAPAENYPFCTIDPNVGIVTVPDPRLEKIAQISHSKKITPTAIEFVDIAGLVKGASAGEGLGNQFLHHIREVDAIVQVVRCFEDSNVHHVSATIDPIRDIEVINTELVLADLGSLQKRRDRLQKQLHAGDKTAKIENAIIEKLLTHLDAGKPAITAKLTLEEKAIARSFFLLTSKPTIFACNVAESDLAAVAGIDDAGRGQVPKAHETGITGGLFIIFSACAHSLQPAKRRRAPGLSMQATKPQRLPARSIRTSSAVLSPRKQFTTMTWPR